MSTFRKELTAFTYADGTRVKGTYVIGAATQITIRASVQPVSGKDLENTPLLRRQKGTVYKLFSNDILYTVNGQKQASRVVIDSNNYEVISKEIWANAVLPHYKYFVSELLAI